MHVIRSFSILFLLLTTLRIEEEIKDYIIEAGPPRCTRLIRRECDVVPPVVSISLLSVSFFVGWWCGGTTGSNRGRKDEWRGRLVGHGGLSAASTRRFDQREKRWDTVKGRLSDGHGRSRRGSYEPRPWDRLLPWEPITCGPFRCSALHGLTGGFSYGHSGQQNPFRFTKGSASLIHMRL